MILLLFIYIRFEIEIKDENIRFNKNKVLIDESIDVKKKKSLKKKKKLKKYILFK